MDKQNHPRLTPEQDRAQRGDDPKQSWTRPVPVLPPGEPKLDQVRQRVLREIEKRRPHDRVVLSPRLLIRAAAGDHGYRTPNGPMPFWESPDIHVVPAAGPTPPAYDPHTNTYGGAAPTLSPVVGQRHWVFVHVWNLGPLPAINTTLAGYWADPTFAFDASHLHPVGTKLHLVVPGNQGPNCHQRICVGAWVPTLVNNGHECMIAIATCTADGGGHTFDAYHDRHVGQRNLNLVRADADLTGLLRALDIALPLGADLELLHGLKDLKPLLVAHHPDLRNVLTAPAHLDPAIAHPIDATTAHLGAAKFVAPGAMQPVPAAAIGPVFAPTGLPPAILSHPVVIGPTLARPTLALMRNLGVQDLHAKSLVAKLTPTTAPGAGHVLRFRATKNGAVVGGYTLIVHA